MFTKKTISYKNSGVLNPLALNYLEKNDELKPFYDNYPDKTGFKNLLQKKPFGSFDRNQLNAILLKQAQLVKNASDSSLNNIDILKQKQSYTVTTGHQLCLFTGPLYFIYKIFSTINLAEQLKKEFSEYDFIPVYWMATEDHDFEEINSFNAFGKTIKWESTQKGAVGEFKTDELSALLTTISDTFGKSVNADYLFSLFENAYLKHAKLADATRFLVNELFGEYGLVVVDGNDKAFKEQFKEQFKKDIFENRPAELVNESIIELGKLGYSAQVKPRAINCFYLEDQSRVRIEKDGTDFLLVGTDKTLTEKELADIVEQHPEAISPNVVLRPVYQQTILPNIAYVGGPGELAYWLEFKHLFNDFETLFPILMPRDFLTVVDKSTKTKIDKLNFSESDFYKSEQDLVKDFLIKSNVLFELNNEKEKIAQLYKSISEKISAIDKTLSGSVSAELQKTTNGLDLISGKANKALKQKSETELNQIKTVKERLFPNNVPQERHENFSSLYIKYGKSFFDELKANLNPFILEQKLFVED